MHYIMALAGFIWLIYTFTSKPKQRIRAKFIVTKAAVNDDEFTDIKAEDDFYFVFYRIGNAALTLSSVMGKDGQQYYGEVQNVDEARLLSSTSSNKHDLLSFNWTYQSDPNKLKSEAFVKIIKTYSDGRVNFDLAVLNQDTSRFLFKGYIEMN